MRMLGLMVVAMSLAAGAALAEGSAGDVPKADALEMAKTAEVKGDLARIDDKYAEAVDYYQKALRLVDQNSKVYNKLGVADLKLWERGTAP